MFTRRLILILIVLWQSVSGFDCCTKYPCTPALRKDLQEHSGLIEQLIEQTHGTGQTIGRICKIPVLECDFVYQWGLERHKNLGERDAVCFEDVCQLYMYERTCDLHLEAEATKKIVYALQSSLK